MTSEGNQPDENTPQAGPQGPASGDDAGQSGGPGETTPHGTHQHTPHPHQSGHGESASAEPGGGDEFDAIVADLDDVDVQAGEAGPPADAESEADAPAAQATGAQAGGSEHERLAAERLEDLRRLQAEYVNYKKRVDRDREVIRSGAISGVVESLIPVLDDIHLARQHGDLTDGPFAAIAEKLEKTLERHGIVRFGAVGEEFDPQVHEALMNVPWDASNEDLPQDASATLVVQVLQPGYRAGERVVRAARVAVSEPD